MSKNTFITSRGTQEEARDRKFFLTRINAVIGNDFYSSAFLFFFYHICIRKKGTNNEKD